MNGHGPAIGWLAALLASACGSTGSAPQAGTPGPAASAAPAAPGSREGSASWPQLFAEGAVLIADEIEIAGPRGLLEHLVLRQEPEYADYAAKTTERGLEQTLARRRDAPEVELRGQLDAWVLVAAERIHAVERPGERAVLLRARGNAVWRPVSGEGERRGPLLEFRGDASRR